MVQLVLGALGIVAVYSFVKSAARAGAQEALDNRSKSEDALADE